MDRRRGLWHHEGPVREALSCMRATLRTAIEWAAIPTNAEREFLWVQYTPTQRLNMLRRLQVMWEAAMAVATTTDQLDDDHDESDVDGSVSSGSGSDSSQLIL